MRKLALSLTLAVLAAAAHSQTLQQCREAAERNFPLIQKYDLIRQTAEIDVANAAKLWLPTATASAQATVQTDAPSWPSQLQTAMRQMGVDLKGLSKQQARFALDLSQSVYDGGAASSQARIGRSEGALSQAQTEASLYQLRQRVGQLYFSLLLADEQLKLSSDLQQVLEANENRLASMLQHGTASESDYLAVKAERLEAASRHASLQASRQTLSRLLSVFCGMEVSRPVRPVKSALSGSGVRPELSVIDAQMQLSLSREQALLSSVRPKLGLFAQALYGYPGLNMFDDMTSRRLHAAAIVGARLTWSLTPLYTLKNNRSRLRLQRQQYAVDRDVFLFNNSLQQIQHSEDIERYRRMADADREIVQLRSKVRQASESRLAHGIIAVSDLLNDIRAENAALVQQNIHEIEMLKAEDDLRHDTNDQTDN